MQETSLQNEIKGQQKETKLDVDSKCSFEIEANDERQMINNCVCVWCVNSAALCLLIGNKLIGSVFARLFTFSHNCWIKSEQCLNNVWAFSRYVSELFLEIRSFTVVVILVFENFWPCFTSFFSFFLRIKWNTDMYTADYQRRKVFDWSCVQLRLHLGTGNLNLNKAINKKLRWIDSKRKLNCSYIRKFSTDVSVLSLKQIP